MEPRVGSVWAPHCDEVHLVVDHDGGAPEIVALEHGTSDWWGGGRELSDGERYGFSLDGSQVHPDPRSRWQPDGVEGFSQVDDPGSFEWRSDPPVRPWSDAVCYELHIGTFSSEGTFLGVIDHLDHLVRLGVTHIELMPVGAWEGRSGWGYDGVAWWAPHPAYGTPNEFRQLVDACHARKLRVLLDVVYNHLGPSGAVLDKFGPYTVAADTPWGRAVNFDGAESSEVRRFVIENALMWIRDQHVDGLRIDAAHAMIDSSPVHILAELSDEVRAISESTGRELVLVAEWDRHDPTPVLSRAAGGWGLSAQWADDLHHALHAHLTEEAGGYYADAAVIPGAIARAMNEVYLPRVVTGDPATEAIGSGISRDRFVVSTQNHDQTGNRPKGERLSSLIGQNAAAAAAAVVMLGPSVPLLFQGEEWAATTPFLYFVEPGDPELSKRVAQGRGEEFSDLGGGDPLDPSDPSTVLMAKLDWTEPAGADQAEILRWYQGLIRVRAAHIQPRFISTMSAREHPDGLVSWTIGDLLIAVNLSDSDLAFDHVEFEEFAQASPLELLLSRLVTGDLMAAWSVGVWLRHS